MSEPALLPTIEGMLIPLRLNLRKRRPLKSPVIAIASIMEEKVSIAREDTEMSLEESPWPKSFVKKVLILEHRTGSLTLELRPSTKVLTLERRSPVLLFSKPDTHPPFFMGVISHVQNNVEQLLEINLGTVGNNQCPTFLYTGLHSLEWKQLIDLLDHIKTSLHGRTMKCLVYHQILQYTT